MIPFVDKTIVKLGLVITLLGLIGGGLTFVHNAIYQAGVDSVKADTGDAYVIREQELNTKLTNALADKDIETAKAKLLQGKLTKSQNDARILRDKINDAVFDCVAIGGDFSELWNESSSKPTD
jgi:hypothetical protein